MKIPVESQHISKNASSLDLVAFVQGVGKAISRRNLPMNLPVSKVVMTSDYKRLHYEAFVADLHCDTIIPMKRGYDLCQRHDTYHIDIPRLMEGGVDLQVFSSFNNPVEKETNPFESVSKSIDFLKTEMSKYNDRMAVCLTSAEAEQAKATHRIGALLSIEGGSALDGDPANLQKFYDKGIRLITVVHEQPTGWCTNWREKNPTIHGLNDLGREMIHEMNRLGIIVDVSHSSDATFEEVLKTSTDPVIASHSCARSLCGHPRNLTDEQIVALAERGGLVGVAFVSFFLSEQFRIAYADYRNNLPPEQTKRLEELFVSELPEEEMQRQVKDLDPFINDMERIFSKLPTSVNTVVDHIDHMVRLVGPNHVGLGSDYDGTSMPPLGLEDCSRVPNITSELVDRGYSEADIKKILGGNFMRIFKEVCG